MDYLQDLFGVAGKAVLVTGGSRGIGLAIAEGFVKSGARVYICSRDPASCNNAVEQLRPYGSIAAIPCNVASTDGRRELVERLQRSESKLDVLINNAGSLWAAPLAEYPESGWDKVFDLNVKATFFLIQQLLPALEAAAKPEDPARIINVGSVNAISIPTHETYAYVSSKAALHQLTRHLASQLASRHVTANVLAPGLYPSKMQTATIERKGLEALVAPIPLKRMANDADVAGTAIFLASKAGAYLTGAVVPVDGGLATTR